MDRTPTAPAISPVLILLALKENYFAFLMISYLKIRIVSYIPKVFA
jgi:hypothetical protein